MAIPVMEAGKSPLLVATMGWGALVVFTSWLPMLTRPPDRLSCIVWPVPERLTLGAGLKLLDRDSVALLAPRVEGVKTTLMVQLAPAASEAPQLLVWVKSMVPMPKIDTPEMESGAPPVLLKVRLWAALLVSASCGAKVSEVTEKVAFGSPPMPARLTDGTAGALLPETLRNAVRVPPVVGVNTTLIEQLAPAGREDPQLLVWMKSPVKFPLMLTETVIAAVPILLNETVCCVLCELTGTVPKLKDCGVIVPTAGTAPVPFRVKGAITPAASLVIVSEPLRAPTAEGRNDILMVQLPPGIKAIGQVFVWTKSPVIWNPLMFRLTSWLLVIVTGWDALTKPTA